MLFWRYALLILASLVLGARAGFIEEFADRTIIHVTVHDWLWDELDPIRTDTGPRANAAAVKAFREKFPGIYAERYKQKYGWDRVEVRIEKFSGIKIEGIESDLLAIAGKMAPDIIYLNFRKSDTYIQQGFLYPLNRPEDAYFTTMSEEDIAFRITPKIRPVIDRKGPGGTYVWALPHGGAIGKVLIYRKDLFDEAKIPYPDKTWTWDDLYQACRKLTKPDQGQYAIALRNVKHESWRWLDFLFASGSQAMHYDEPSDTWEIAFDNTNAVEALDYYVKLCTEPWQDAEGRKRRDAARHDPGRRFCTDLRSDRGRIGADAHRPQRETNRRLEQQDARPVFRDRTSRGARRGLGIHPVLRLRGGDRDQDPHPRGRRPRALHQSGLPEKIRLR
jgi:ABC-type glycerol-3-phosphate transport system substrate-binding protein